MGEDAEELSSGCANTGGTSPVWYGDISPSSSELSLFRWDRVGGFGH